MIFETHAAITLLIEPNSGKIVDASQAAIEFYGYPKDKLCSMTINQINMLPPEQVNAERLLALQEKRNYFVFPHRLANGEVRVVEVHSSPIMFSEGPLLLSIIHDITEQKRMESKLAESESKYRQLFETMHQGVIYYDEYGRIIDANPAAIRILGLSPEILHQNGFSDPGWKTYREDGSDLPDMEHPIYQALHFGRNVENFILRLVNPKRNQPTWFSSSAIPLYRAGGEKAYMVYTTFEDITQRKLIEQALQQSEEKYRVLFEILPTGVTVSDKNGQIEFVNPAYASMLGYSPDQLIGKKPKEFSPPEDRPAMEEQFKLRSQGKTTTYETRLLRADGSQAPVVITAMPRSAETISGAIAVVTDLTKQKETEKALKQAQEELKIALDHERLIANMDGLTGLNNRRRLYELAQERFLTATRYNQPLTVILFDIDHFKQVNDEFGHDAGDEVLRNISRAACAELRTVDVIGRIGGEEFVVLLPMTQSAQAFLVAERIRKAVEQTVSHTGQHDISVTLSIGVAEIRSTQPEKGVEDLFRCADQAMYHAKTLGRNQTSIFME